VLPFPPILQNGGMPDRHLAARDRQRVIDTRVIRYILNSRNRLVDTLVR
jgi:hypothetical protein